MIDVKKEKKKVALKIGLATGITIFTLFATLSGTYAWFVSKTMLANTTDDFSVVNVSDEGGMSLDTVNLIKFNYAYETLGGIRFYDYDHPERGEVKRYEYDTTHKGFGEIVEGEWEEAIMNLYDPVDKIINNMPLIRYNSNVLYEIELSVSTAGTYSLDILSDRLVDKVIDVDNNEIYLSEVVDFDVYYVADLSSSEFVIEDGRYNYYPETYLDDDYVMNEKEEIYYKFSYLSSLELSHSHFYTSGEKPTTITLESDKEIVIPTDNYKLKVYINANYAPGEMEPYIKRIYSTDVLARFDFIFSFDFEREAE